MSATSALRSFVVAVGVLSTILVGVSAAGVSASSEDTSVTAGISVSKNKKR